MSFYETGIPEMKEIIPLCKKKYNQNKILINIKYNCFTMKPNGNRINYHATLKI